ncbi:MAG: hypothetical protein AVDCRST_MAG19-1086, partial [uncultured Thermomicrobiales bacterium]
GDHDHRAGPRADPDDDHDPAAIAAVRWPGARRGRHDDGPQRVVELAGGGADLGGRRVAV